MKKLLLGIYVYMGLFFALCLLTWLLTGDEPEAVITGVSAAAGVESLISGWMRICEMREERKQPRMASNGRTGRAGSMQISPQWGEK